MTAKFFEIVIIGSVIFIYAIVTYQRNFVWQNDLSLWQDVVKKSPLKARGYNNLGKKFNDLNKPKEAIKVLKIALSLCPYYAPVYTNLGISYCSLKAYIQGIQLFRKALSLDPYQFEAFYNLGMAYSEMGHDDKAIHLYRHAIELNPFDSDVHYNLGLVYKNRHFYKQAIDEFKKTIELRPNDYKPYLNIGMISLYHLKDREKALYYLSQALKLNPQQPQAFKIRQTIMELKKRGSR